MDNTANSNPSTAIPAAFDARTERVLALRAQIADGTYAIDHRAVAEAILREHGATDAALEPSSPATALAEPALRDFSRFVVVPTPPEVRKVAALTA